MDPNDQKKTACYDIDVEVDDTLKTQMNSFLLSTASQQEIAGLDNKVQTPPEPPPAVLFAKVTGFVPTRTVSPRWGSFPVSCRFGETNARRENLAETLRWQRERVCFCGAVSNVVNYSPVVLPPQLSRWVHSRRSDGFLLL